MISEEYELQVQLAGDTRMTQWFGNGEGTREGGESQV